MSVTCRRIGRILALSFALAIPACGGSDPQSPESTSISGTVVFDQTGSPAAGVDVILERHQGTMMMEDHWNHTGHTMTDSDGRFHFEYTHDAMHHYRVGVQDMDDWHTCDGAGRDEDGLVLRIPSQIR